MWESAADFGALLVFAEHRRACRILSIVGVAWCAEHIELCIQVFN